MTQDEVVQLERAQLRLKSRYEGALKGTPVMISTSMRIAYARGIADAINMLADEGFDIVARTAEVPLEVSGEAV